GCARRLVLGRATGRAAVVVEVALGLADQGRQVDGAFPGVASDAAGVRRARGPQRHQEPRRDPLLGGLPDAGQGRLHLRRYGPATWATAGLVVCGRWGPYLLHARR